jgi:succinate dehydrogenase/fumarate reductase flavoprotein subunit
MTAARSFALTVTIMGVVALAVSAQPPPANPLPPPAAGGVAGLPAAAGYETMALWGQQATAHHRASELARGYVKAEKESEKREIRQKMTDLLNEQFDEHMQQQQKELEDLEKQISELRAVLKKRSAAKAAIVDRRIEQMIQDADGMGWTAPGSPRGYYNQSYGPGGAFSVPLRPTAKTPPPGK